MKTRKHLLILFIIIFFTISASTSILLHQDVEDDSGFESTLLRLSGALRVFIVDACWMRMRSHMQEGNESLVLSDARTLLSLQPNSERVRYYLHFHLTFNMPGKAVSEESRAEWYKEGMSIMDEGLAKSPDSFMYNFAMATAFYLRTGKCETFKKVCHERYNKFPIQLAPEFFEKACKINNDIKNFFYYIDSMIDAARFETETKNFSSAATLWSKIYRRRSRWLDGTFEEEFKSAFVEYIIDLNNWCSIMDRIEKGEEVDAGLGKEIKRLQDRIMKNNIIMKDRNCDLNEEAFRFKEKE